MISFGEQYECEQVVAGKNSYELDFALLNLHGNAATKWGKLALEHTDPIIDRPLFIVQHPGGQPKMISKTNCTAKAVPVSGRASETDFTHTCDTVGGSSGSPVFNEAGQVIGLHHYGFGTGGEWNENRAVRMNRILDYLGQ
jgi:V8-like Glu-specific endopeptidase